jgi:hypothetical protein
MQQHRSRLLSTTYMTLALGSGLLLLTGTGIAPGSSGLALAQCKAAAVDCANPCNASNPCCANPCAASANPCAATNPCAAAAPINPCNPCAAENPCNPCKAG